jgi:hypothetical protein
VKVAAWDMRMPLESRMMFSLKGATLPSHAASSSRSAGAAATKFLIIRDDVPLSKKRVFGSRG